MDAFTLSRWSSASSAHGDTKSSVRLRGGFQADLRLVPAESRGAALQYFTGSKAHNIALRDRAIQRGLKLNEYGLYRVDDEHARRRRDEEGIYEALGLALVPPELRENRGEIEAAERTAAAALVERRRPARRSALHTTATDGHDDIETMALAARDAGPRVPRHHRPQPGARDGQRARRARARSRTPRAIRALDDAHRRHHACWPASSATSGRRHAWTSPTTASPQLDIVDRVDPLRASTRTRRR